MCKHSGVSDLLYLEEKNRCSGMEPVIFHHLHRGALPENAAAYTSPDAGLLNKYLFDNDTTPVAVRSTSGTALRMSSK